MTNSNLKNSINQPNSVSLSTTDGLNAHPSISEIPITISVSVSYSPDSPKVLQTTNLTVTEPSVCGCALIIVTQESISPPTTLRAPKGALIFP